MRNNKIWILWTILPFFSCVYGFPQEITLHESFSQDGDHLHFTTHVSREDGSLFKKIKRVCARGWWTVSMSPNFQTHTGMFGSDTGSVICKNSSFPYLSFRYVGARDTTVSALSLYEGEKLEKREFFVNETAYPSIPHEVKSFGYTGSAKWLLFEGPNFEGKSNCFKGASQVGWSRPQEYNLEKIGSVFKSCDEKALEMYKQKGGAT